MIRRHSALLILLPYVLCCSLAWGEPNAPLTPVPTPRASLSATPAPEHDHDHHDHEHHDHHDHDHPAPSASATPHDHDHADHGHHHSGSEAIRDDIPAVFQYMVREFFSPYFKKGVATVYRQSTVPCLLALLLVAEFLRRRAWKR